MTTLIYKKSDPHGWSKYSQKYPESGSAPVRWDDLKGLIDKGTKSLTMTISHPGYKHPIRVVLVPYNITATDVEDAECPAVKKWQWPMHHDAPSVELNDDNFNIERVETSSEISTPGRSGLISWDELTAGEEKTSGGTVSFGAGNTGMQIGSNEGTISHITFPLNAGGKFPGFQVQRNTGVIRGNHFPFPPGRPLRA